jgi:serine phosphatase RsbU (regulator of sigma subunit)
MTLFLFLGIFSVMLLYNFFVFLSTKEAIYLPYLAIIFINIVALGTNFGYSVVLLKDAEWYVQYMGVIDLFLSFIFGTTIIFFTKQFLNVKKHFPILNKVLNALIVLIGLSILPGLMGNVFAGNNISSLLGLVTFVVVTTAAVKGYLKKLPSSGFFLSAFSCFVIGVVTFLLYVLGVVPSLWLTNYSMQIGASLEALLFAFALANKINILKKENEEKHLEIIKHLRENELLQTKVNRELEEKVLERTREIQEKNEEIAMQNEELLQQAEVLMHTSNELEARNNNINASIRYAYRIQKTMLPSKDLLESIFKEYFVLYAPKDVVSGDFYWAAQSDNYHAWAVCDCTGHGVPGALMSTIGISLLNEIFFKRKVFLAKNVLELARESLVEALSQQSAGNTSRDSIDMALCIYNTETNTIDFAGARIPLWLIKPNGELVEIKPNKQTVGIYGDHFIPFTSEQITPSQGDTIYLFSDGIVDQFGGLSERKFGKNNLRKLMDEIYSLPAIQQHERMEQTLAMWRGRNEQTDDMTLMCIKF